MSQEKIPFSPLPRTVPVEVSDYVPPTKGWLSKVPLKAQPYLQLMRLDRLHAALYFYIPQLLGSLLAATLHEYTVKQLFFANASMLLFTFFFRGVANAWNDVLDVEFDKQVERTRHRPLARGAITVQQGIAFVISLVACCFSVYPLFPPVCRAYATLWIATAMLYPLSKRVTMFPQGIFGLIMSLGVFVGATSIKSNVNPDEMIATSDVPRQLYIEFAELFSGHASEASMALLSLYGAHVAWSICYETIYSYQDVADDDQAGVKNIALLMPNKGKYFLAMWALTSVCCLALMGYMMDARPSFFSHIILGIGLILTIQITQVDLKKPSSCRTWFAIGGMTAGAAMVDGLAGEYAQRIVM